VRALVIDDSRVMRAILRKFLERFGFDVVEAGDGREGLERLKGNGPFDIALVDWNMPQLDGLGFVQAVRADGANADLRVVMVTTENEKHRIAAALEAGADEFIMKPFTEETLQDKLALLGIAHGEDPHSDS
jgi:two-component system, chemotaxis family, chemotaxis protein CheY